MTQPRSLRRSIAAPIACGLALLAAAAAQAGVNRWTPIGLGSGDLRDLAVDRGAPGVLYAAAGPAGIYRSADGGESWTWRGTPIGRNESWTAVVVDPGDPARLYATTEHADIGTGAVWTSADRGQTWTELLRRRDGFNAVAVSRDGTLLAAGELAEVFRSTDRGATWAIVLRPQFGAGGLELELAFDPGAPDVALVGAEEGLWRSTDRGATWARIGTWPSGEPVEDVAALAFPGTRPGFLYALMRSRIYRSLDGGLTWSGGVVTLGAFTALAVDPADPATVYVAAFSVWVSHDGGDTATEVSSQFPHWYFPHVQALAISEAAPETLYAGVPGLGVVASRDGGGSWSIGEQRGLTAQANFVPQFRAGASGRLYHRPYRDGTLFRSDDHGATWTALGGPPISSITALVEEPGAPDRLWVASSSGFFHSVDGGATWSPSTLSTITRFTEAAAVPAPGVVLAGGCGLWRSADGGATWSPVLRCVVGEAGGLGSRFVVRLGAVPGWPGRVWAEVLANSHTGAQRTLVLFSENAGRTWRTLARLPFPPSTPVVTAARGVLYLNREHVLLRSADGGAHWDLGGSVGDLIDSVAVDPLDPLHVLIGTERQGVLRSLDGGETWSAANGGLARLGRRAVGEVVADPAVPATFYALPWQGGVFQATFDP